MSDLIFVGQAWNKTFGRKLERRLKAYAKRQGCFGLRYANDPAKSDTMAVMVAKAKDGTYVGQRAAEILEATRG